MTARESKTNFPKKTIKYILLYHIPSICCFAVQVILQVLLNQNLQCFDIILIAPNYIVDIVHISHTS